AAMMRAAADAATGAPSRPLVLAVTVLTSLGDEDLAATSVTGNAAAQVMRLAELAKLCGLDGVVCSAREAEALRAKMGNDFKLVVPGIRPEWAAKDDQKRITTPSQAVKLGADYLVIGRPITGADDPVIAAKRIVDELGG
ncbi:MAG: orotidine-5'-phosphate decarboxylase, partial [Rhodospirillales bacterium]